MQENKRGVFFSEHSLVPRVRASSRATSIEPAVFPPPTVHILHFTMGRLYIMSCPEEKLQHSPQAGNWPVETEIKKGLSFWRQPETFLISIETFLTKSVGCEPLVWWPRF